MMPKKNEYKYIFWGKETEYKWCDENLTKRIEKEINKYLDTLIIDDMGLKEKRKKRI